MRACSNSELEATTLTVLVGHSGPPHVWGVGSRVPGELMERGLGHGHLLCAVLGTEEPGAGGADALREERKAGRHRVGWDHGVLARRRQSWSHGAG